MKDKKYLKIISYIFLLMFSFNKIVFAEGLNCNALGDLKTDLENLFNLLKIILPLLIIVLSIYDFIKSITAKDEKDMKKSFQNLIKRFIYAVILFVLPVLINFLLEFFGTNSTVCIE